ncbi:MAG TPA: UDP-N-acetylglucosamine 2-epimerase [Synergistales bacterium]|nr:UDP-N-acetylglucosamine 2-epimerase [Synergistales bacterium]HQQ09957.1 UDP-N-acetylglucosamine 2-epimerase [Synergistales bacterium]
MKRKIAVVVTARPSYARIKTALSAMDDHPGIELQLVVAASALLDRYGSASTVIEKDGFRIASCVFMLLEGETPQTSAITTGLGLLEMATVFENLKPDIVVTIADRFETMATATAAAFMNLPLVHVQGGEVTGSIDEKVRHAVTKLADLHFVATEKARERIIRMGEEPSRVFITGCPSIDLAAEVARHPERTFDPFTSGVGAKQDLSGPYLVVLQHPVTTEYALARDQAIETLYAVRSLGLPVLWFWPNSDAGSDGTSKAIRWFRENENTDKFHFFKNFPPEAFLQILNKCSCVIGNSSVAIRECAFLGIPAVNIGNRQDGRERGCNAIDTPGERESIVFAVKKQIAHGRFPSDQLYGKGEAGSRIASLLASVPLSIEKRLTY